MASLRYIVPALAIAGGAAAATCSVSATTTIQNAGDASGLATCQTFSGSIAIATGTSDTIDLSGIEELTGSLTADSAKNLPAISSNTLTTIGDTFSLQNLTTLSSLNFPDLKEVHSIDWNGLPGLQGLSFTTGVQMAQNLSIQNTYLNSLDGINLQEVGTVLLANNPKLASVNMQLANASNSLTIAANGAMVSAEFPNLIWANELIINNVSTFSIPSLAAVNTSIYFNSDYFSSISAPNLTTVGNALSIIDCNSLTNVSFPQLKSVGSDLKIGNNTALNSITGFPVLSTIGGALDFHGNLTNVSIPDISYVAGTVNIQSSGNITDSCNTIGQKSSDFRGGYYCNGSIATPTSGNATGTSSGSSTTTTNAASVMQLTATTGLLGVMAVIFGML